MSSSYHSQLKFHWLSHAYLIPQTVRTDKSHRLCLVVIEKTVAILLSSSVKDSHILCPHIALPCLYCLHFDTDHLFFTNVMYINTWKGIQGNVSESKVSESPTSPSRKRHPYSGPTFLNVPFHGGAEFTWSTSRFHVNWAQMEPSPPAPTFHHMTIFLPRNIASGP